MKGLRLRGISVRIDNVVLTEIFASSSNRSPYTTSLDNFDSRLAFAWQPVTSLVLRGGVGCYYGPSTHMVARATLTAIINITAAQSRKTDLSTPWVACVAAACHRPYFCTASPICAAAFAMS